MSIGSSPRTRGTVVGIHDKLHDSRFIPANAGNRVCQPPLPARSPVHPRERGEQCQPQKPDEWGSGSSPRTRGTVLVGRPNGQKTRFIPANAGNSCRLFITRPPKAVHPRERGEQVRVIWSVTGHSGSSPRTRGTEHERHSRCAEFRFIPANAGNRLGRSPPTAAAAVHPRERGEQHWSLLLWPS